MCTRFVYNSNDAITGFNLNIGLPVWNHRIIKKKDQFYIGIKMPDGLYHSFHGINKTENVATLLYVHGNPAGMYTNKKDCYTISDLAEQYIHNRLSFDGVLDMAKTKKIVYAPDATMEAMFSDASGRVLIVEPESTKPFIVAGDCRYEKAGKLWNVNFNGKIQKGN